MVREYPLFLFRWKMLDKREILAKLVSEWPDAIVFIQNVNMCVVMI